jgi:hypothetical protein
MIENREFIGSANMVPKEGRVGRRQQRYSRPAGEILPHRGNESIFGQAQIQVEELDTFAIRTAKYIEWQNAFAHFRPIAQK